MPILSSYLIDLSASVRFAGTFGIFALIVTAAFDYQDRGEVPRWLKVAIAAIVILMALMPSQETARLIAGVGS